jgi:branched-chain amino acid transport system ATP-binding protein
MNNEIIKTENLTIDFMGFVAVNRVNLSIKEGEVVGLVGPNGAGKSTLLNLLTGYYMPTIGKVFYKNIDITNYLPERRILLGISRTFQIVSTFSNLTVRENLCLSCYRKLNNNSLFLKALLNKIDYISRNYKEVNSFINKFSFKNIADEYVANLPMGKKRELEIAMSLINNPDVIFLDEPLAGLGDVEIENLLIIIKQFFEQKTVIIIEHKISKLKDLVERIIVLNQGEIIADGSFDTVFQSQEVRKVYWKVK